MKKQDKKPEAVKKDPSIRYSDVKSYLDKLPHRQTQFTYKGYNSFVSPHPLFEIELDLIDMTVKAEENDGYRYAMVGIDNFSKFAWAVPMKNKASADVVTAFKEIIEKIGKPAQLYSDREGAFESREFIKLLNDNKINHLISNAGAPGVERFNRTLKEKTMLRLDAMNLDKFKWVEQLKPILNKYNNTIHTTIKMSPNDAKKRGNKDVVWFNIWDKAKRNRQYLELALNDHVRVKVKKELTTKGYDAKWSKNVFKIVFVKNNEYLINDGKRKVYLRHEILKV